MERAKRNVTLLVFCQALFTSSSSLMIAVGGLVGYALADDKALATLPISAGVVGTALGTIPAAAVMRWRGRRVGFICGSVAGISGGLVCVAGLVLANFWVFVLGTLITGMAVAFAQLYRFAAADTATEGFKSKAISYVLAGGLIAGFIGPQLAKWSKDLVETTPFLASYLAVSILWALSIPLQGMLDIPRPRSTAADSAVRPLRQITGQPVFIVAAISGMIGYGVMSLMMTATPLAMVAHQHPFSSAATVIQWHLVGMFLPSFFTGNLIARFGVLPIMASGVLLNLGSVAAGMSGTGFFNYWLALLLVGMGWNFMFIGGSTLITESCTPLERPKTQAANDFLIFGTVALASLGSGQLLHHWGWLAVSATALPLLSVALGAVGWLVWHGRRKVSPQPA